MIVSGVHGCYFDMTSILSLSFGQCIVKGGDDGKAKLIISSEHWASASAIAFEEKGQIPYSASPDGTVQDSVTDV